MIFSRSKTGKLFASSFSSVKLQTTVFKVVTNFLINRIILHDLSKWCYLVPLWVWYTVHYFLQTFFSLFTFWTKANIVYRVLLSEKWLQYSALYVTPNIMNSRLHYRINNKTPFWQLYAWTTNPLESMQSFTLNLYIHIWRMTTSLTQQTSHKGLLLGCFNWPISA